MSLTRETHPETESSLRARIAELEHQNRALQDSELFLNTILENIPDMIFVKEAKELRFARFNRAGENLLGYTNEELLGKNDYDLFPREEADHFTSEDREVIVAGKVKDIPEETIHTKHRGIRYLHTKKLPVFDRSGQPLYLLGISEDITARKMAEQERDQSQEKVSQLERQKRLSEIFVSTLSHDLRGPLTAARAGADLLVKFPERKDLLTILPNRIIESLNRLDRMIQNLLDANRIQAGMKVQLQLVETRFSPLVSELVDELTTLHGARFDVECDSSILGHWSPEDLRRILENLLGNAVKFSYPNTQISIRAEKRGEMLFFTVQNFGPAIPIENIPKLFEPYSRDVSRGKNPATGWGLGLTLVKGAVESHGGSVRVSSDENAGTTFEVELPLDSRPFQDVSSSGI